MTNLVHFSIGPVQSFIVQARKTQDLFAGSQLLSDLCEKAMSVIGQENIIFPAQANSKNAALPNRFLAKISGKSDEELSELLKKAEITVRGHFKKVADESYVLKTGRSKMVHGFDTQIDNFLEIYYAWYPMAKDDFNTAFKKLERLLTGLKSTRHFVQFEYPDGMLGEAGRKCHLDGERNALFFGKGTNSAYLRQGIEMSDHHIYVDKNEGLSAVNFVKRFYKKDSQDKYEAESIAEIALKHKIWEKTEHGFVYHEAFKQYQDFIINKLGYYDEQLCYEENLLSENLGAHYQKICALHECIISKRIKKNADRHYAVLRFDGDNMGKWISGEYVQDYELDEFQSRLSTLLISFAEIARTRILTNHKGATVYAGGDDFIGLVNLHHLLPVLSALRAAFKSEVNDPLLRFFPTISHEITFSAGIAIAHYKTPLSIVLKEAKKAEDHAKAINPAKNAVAICRIKKSGETQVSRFQFGAARYNSNFEFTGFENLNRVDRILEALNSDFSTSFIRAYQRAFAPVGTEFCQIEEDMAKTELLRLITRSRNDSSVSRKKCQDLCEDFLPFLVEPDFEDFLNLIDFLHRQTSK